MEAQYENAARVAHVLDMYTFIINRRSKDGVQIGQNFLIFRLGDRIMDPKSGEDLGVLELVRGRARVTHVQDQMSTLETTDVETIPGKVKKFRRNSMTGLMAFTGAAREEVIEEGSETKKVNTGVQIGDMARPIKFVILCTFLSTLETAISVPVNCHRALA